MEQKLNNRHMVTLLARLKREAGVSPARSRHCNVKNRLVYTTDFIRNWEGKRFVEAEPGNLPCGRTFFPTGDRRV